MAVSAQLIRRAPVKDDGQIDLGSRWYPLRPHEGQKRLWNSEGGKRFMCCHAGRRGGKTEIAKRKLIRKASAYCGRDPGNFGYLAPTRDQAKRIAWEDLKALVAPAFRAGEPLESTLTIPLVNGSTVYVLGMDKPQRVEGTPWDGLVVDEFGDMPAGVWDNTLRPAVSTVDRPGWVLMIGKPKGRNHWYRRCQQAAEDTSGEWGVLSWSSRTVIGDAEADQMMDEMDERAYRAEIEGEFVPESNRAYYSFDASHHARPCAHLYNPNEPLAFTFDFNVEPGVACVVQKVNHPELGLVHAAMGEIWIPRNSNTVAVCREVARQWAKHAGNIHLYGDASGGARHTSQVNGSDWEIIDQELALAFNPTRIKSYVARKNPPERVRINSVNFALRSAAGKTRFIVDPKCQHLIADLEGVGLNEQGEIEKRKDKTLTHLSDSVGYYLHEECPSDASAPTYVQR